MGPWRLCLAPPSAGAAYRSTSRSATTSISPVAFARREFRFESTSARSDLSSTNPSARLRTRAVSESHRRPQCLARAPLQRLEGHPRDAAHETPDRGQGPVDADALRTALGQRAAVPYRARRLD